MIASRSSLKPVDSMSMATMDCIILSLGIQAIALCLQQFSLQMGILFLFIKVEQVYHKIMSCHCEGVLCPTLAPHCVRYSAGEQSPRGVGDCLADLVSTSALHHAFRAANAVQVYEREEHSLYSTSIVFAITWGVRAFLPTYTQTTHQTEQPVHNSPQDISHHPEQFGIAFAAAGRVSL